MISINNLSVNFGSFELLKNISFVINPNDRIGLVGKNGAGKSTILKIIAKEISASKGEIVVPNELSIGYLPQQLDTKDGKSVIEETITTFEEVIKLNNEIEYINKQLTERTDYESEDYIKLCNKLTEKNEHFDIIGGGNTETRAEQTLLGLGFKRSDLNRATAEFSGGWRMRIELAKILLKQPDIFLLDEPTNHLDIESIQWLENFLKDYRGAVLLISHDRTFLDTVTNRTIEISAGKINDYKVPYSKYVVLRKERREQELAAYENQQKMIAETEKFIERFRYKATKAVQVQSRIKQLEKLNRIEIEEEDLSAVNFRFPPAPRSGDLVISTKNLAKRFGELTVFQDAYLDIERGEKVAFVGKNGEGKTTFTRIIMQELDFDGIVKIGHNVKIGYFAQNQDKELDNNKTVEQTLDDIAVGEVRKNIRNILGSFLFRGDDIDKKVSVLSGGERSRLAMAKLLLEPYSLLLLDEPTNHLDIKSKDRLKQALQQYNGTLIIVSHDRDFLDGLVNKVYEFRDKRIREHLGGIQDFIYRRKLETLKEIEEKQIEQKQQKTTKNTSNKNDYLQRKEEEKVLRKIRNKIKKAEENIHKLETEIEKYDEKLASPKGINLDNDFYSEYENLKKKLDEEMELWETYCVELEEKELKTN